MYLEHFGLTEPPFRLSPDPHFLFPSKHHSRAKAYMESTVLLQDGFVIITGEIGAGKTTLIKSFIDELGDEVILAHVAQTQLTPVQFLQTVLADFGHKAFQKRKAELLDLLNHFLIEQYEQGKKCVLIVDEAQNLSAKVLEEVRLLSGIETATDKVLRIILAGQPELNEKLEGMEQLTQRVRLRFHLGPLTESETCDYIKHRLTIAGSAAGALFDDEIYPLIYRYTGGIPRLINTLCDTAMLCAFAEEHERVGVGDIEEALDDLQWDEFAERTNKFRLRGTRHPRLRILCDGECIDELALDQGRLIIGRTSDNDLQINSKYVSRHHAQLITDADQCYIEDLNSTNGIYLGKQRIKKRTLRDGDIVSLGKHSLVFLDGAADEDEADEIDDSDDEELEDSDAERKDNAA